MLCALEGLATKHGDEKTRNISQVIDLQFLKLFVIFLACHSAITALLQHGTSILADNAS